MGSGIINIHEAKTHLSRLVEEACEGKELVIAKAGKPLVRLTPVTAPRRVRKPGFLKGKIKIAADFDAPCPMRNSIGSRGTREDIDRYTDLSLVSRRLAHAQEGSSTAYCRGR